MDISYKEMYKMNPKEAKRRLLEIYLKTNSISKTARLLNTSREVVHKWVRSYEEIDTDTMNKLFRRPKNSPNITSPQIKKLVIQARKETGHSRKCLLLYLWRKKGLNISPHKVPHVLRRNGFKKISPNVRSSIQLIGLGKLHKYPFHLFK